MKAEIAIGVLLGLLLSGAVGLFPLSDTPWMAPESSLLFADQGGSIKEFVIHYTAGADKVVGPAYREFLKEFDDNVIVHLMVPNRNALDEFKKKILPLGPSIKPHITGHEMTTWSRDRWVVLQQADKSILLRPRSEMLAGSWAARAGDQRIADDLANDIADLKAARSFLYFDGGDFVSDDETVFVSPNVIRRNLQLTVEDRDELKQRLRILFGKKVILLDQAPQHHAGMFMMPVGNRTVLVSDPSLGKKLAACGTELDSAFTAGPDFSSLTQKLYDSVAERCRSAGYKVIRIPSLHGSDDRAYITYVNGILDQRDGKKIAYIPSYKNFPVLNKAAAKIWKRAGYQPVMIDATDTYRLGGTLRCLVNILKRSA